MLFCQLILSVLCRCTFWVCVPWRSFAILPHFRRTSPVCRQKHPHPVNVVRQVAQTDFHSRSGYADRPQQQSTRFRVHPILMHPIDNANNGIKLRRAKYNSEIDNVFEKYETVYRKQQQHGTVTLITIK
jgi:hypothetical protein